MPNTIKRRGNNNKFNVNGNKHSFFDKNHMIPKEDYAALSPETKDFWNYNPNKDKASILRSTRDKPKLNPTFPTKPPFNIKVNNSEIIEALIHEYLILEEYDIIEDET